MKIKLLVLVQTTIILDIHTYKSHWQMLAVCSDSHFSLSWASFSLCTFFLSKVFFPVACSPQNQNTDFYRFSLVKSYCHEINSKMLLILLSSRFHHWETLTFEVAARKLLIPLLTFSYLFPSYINLELTGDKGRERLQRMLAWTENLWAWVTFQVAGALGQGDGCCLAEEFS